MKERIRVGLLFGGRSCEHEVSVISARSVLEAIDKDKYEVVLIGISKEGQWLTSGEDRSLLERDVVEGDDLIPVFLDYSGGGGLVFREADSRASGQGIDVVFPILHGPHGEDGTIQGLLELAGIPYVGAGVVGSAVGMDKEMTRRVFRAEGLPQVEHAVVRRRRWEKEPDAVQEEIEAHFSYPLFVKPVSLGSSVGVTKAHDSREFRVGMDEAASFDCKIMIEAEAAGCREIEVAILGDEDPQASVAGEIVPGREFYDYEAKYLDDSSELIIPARLSSETTEQVRQMAVQAFRAAGAEGMARVDFFVGKEDERIYVNEINTIPGFTPISMYPRLWEASGVPYAELIDRLIQLGLERHAEKQKTRAAL